MKIFKHYRNTINLGGRRLVPGHWTIGDYWAILKHYFKYKIWYKYIGHYKLVDEKKYMKIPPIYFTLSQWQIDKIKELNWNYIEYRFQPTPIGNGVKIRNIETSDVVDITDYDTW